MKLSTTTDSKDQPDVPRRAAIFHKDPGMLIENGEDHVKVDPPRPAFVAGISPVGAILSLCGTLLLLFVGCETVPKEIYPLGEAEPPALYSTISTQHGKASYYAGRWIGRKTANGEIYRAGDVTAAHKTLPFHTMVRVTNLRNGKSVIVRINNRGPYIKGRIIDLSWEAAKAIEMVKAGVVPVKVEVLREIPVMTRPNLKLPREVSGQTPIPQSRRSTN